MRSDASSSLLAPFVSIRVWSSSVSNNLPDSAGFVVFRRQICNLHYQRWFRHHTARSRWAGRGSPHAALSNAMFNAAEQAGQQVRWSAATIAGKTDGRSARRGVVATRQRQKARWWNVTCRYEHVTRLYAVGKPVQPSTPCRRGNRHVQTTVAVTAPIVERRRFTLPIITRAQVYGKARMGSGW